MEIQVLADTPKLVRVALSGQLDTQSVGQIETKISVLMAGKGQDAILDMSDVSLITSLGVGMLISVSRVVKRRGAKFVLLNLQPAVAMVIELCRLSDLLGVASDEAIAQSMLSAASG